MGPRGARGRAWPAKRRAVFLDRDGVLNDLDYDPDEGRVSAPLSARRLRVFPYAGAAVRQIRALGFLAIVVSNQPGVAKRQITQSELDRMNRKVREEVSKGGGEFDGEYYCLHHPDARVGRLKEECACRKPKPGLLLMAARDFDLDLGASFFVGDALVDVKAGKAAGCGTVLLGHQTAFLSDTIDREGARPDFLLPSLKAVPGLLKDLEMKRRPQAAPGP